MDTNTLIVYCTVPDAETGKSISEILVKERLCACVNRLSGVVSHYMYDGEYCESGEELLMIKTTETAFAALQRRIETLHPYDVPEIIAAGIAAGNESYLQWLNANVQ